MLTQLEEIFVGYLKTYDMKRGDRAIVFLMLRRKGEQMPEMFCYMEEYPEATVDELMQKAEEISQKGELNEAP